MELPYVLMECNTFSTCDILTCMCVYVCICLYMACMMHFYSIFCISCDLYIGYPVIYMYVHVHVLVCYQCDYS